MTIIYVTENNCRCLAVTFKNNGFFRVQKLKDVSKDKNIIYEVNPLRSFIGKSKNCTMTQFSGAAYNKAFDGNTILLKVGEENNKHRYVYIGGDQVCSFVTDDEIYEYISNMGNNLSPYSVGIGFKNIYYLTPYFRIIKKEDIGEYDNNKLFDVDYDTVTNYQKLKTYKIFSNYD